MRIKSILFMLGCFLLSCSFTLPLLACECDPVCEGCESCEAGVCVDDPDNCIPCQNCVDGECEDDDDLCEDCETCSIAICDSDCTGCESCENDACEDDDTKCSTCQECVDGDCTSCADLGKACCNNKCVVSTDDCWGIDLTIIYDGSCACFTPSITCMSDDTELRDLGYGKMASYVRECVRVPNGTCGRTQCEVLEGVNQTIAKFWTCRDEEDIMGVLLCWELNALVCIVQCSAAASACALNPGSPDCSQGLDDCAQCLTSEGIDCGCLTVSCFYNEPPSEVVGETLAAYGSKCGRP